MLFLEFTCPESRKWASSENHTLFRKSGSSSILSQNHSHILTRFLMSSWVNFCLIWILYGYRFRYVIRILLTDSLFRPSSWLRRHTDLLGPRTTDSLHSCNVLWCPQSFRKSIMCLSAILFSIQIQYCSMASKLIHPLIDRPVRWTLTTIVMTPEMPFHFNDGC